MQNAFLVSENGGPQSPLATDEQTRAFLASIVESSDDSIIGTDLNGTILSWNAGSERLWGYRAAEAIGKHITILFLPDRKPDYMEHLARISRQERVERFESVRMRQDGSTVQVSVILSPIKDDNGRIHGLSAIYSDITRYKQAQAELVKAKEAAEAASRAKSEFLANMSHEIRTPMNGILGMLDVALESDLTPELREYLETARVSAGTLLEILNDILEFSKIEAKRIEVEQIPLSVAETVREAFSVVAALADNKGLDLQCRVGTDMPFVLLGDPTRLRQVLINLINNAIKFTERGSVEVRAEVDGADGEEAVVRFEVADTGIGMSEAEREVIFEAFRQGDGSSTRRYGGTGLGLSICQRLLGLMGGQLWVESQEGKGSTFFFTVRLKQPTDLEAVLRY